MSEIGQVVAEIFNFSCIFWGSVKLDEEYFGTEWRNLNGSFSVIVGVGKKNNAE